MGDDNLGWSALATRELFLYFGVQQSDQSFLGKTTMTYSFFGTLVGFVLLPLCPMLVVAQQRPSVIEAVHKGHAVGHEQDGIEAVRSALAAGSDVNERDQNGWTPLMHAALECRPQILKLLLEKGADAKLHAKSSRSTSYIDHGQSALTVAAGCFIARQRAKLAPSRGMPQAYIESEQAAPSIMVRELMAHGADPNAADADGRTPLMMAVMQQWVDVVTVLLAKKVSVNARDHEGRLAVDYADTADREIINLLRKAGSEAPTGQSGRTVCDAERALDQRGYDTPIIDCIGGRQLNEVITKFQKDNALPASGDLDSATRKALNIR